jgi:hypothetical protein
MNSFEKAIQEEYFFLILFLTMFVGAVLAIIYWSLWEEKNLSKRRIFAIILFLVAVFYTLAGIIITWKLGVAIFLSGSYSWLSAYFIVAAFFLAPAVVYLLSCKLRYRLLIIFFVILSMFTFLNVYEKVKIAAFIPKTHAEWLQWTDSPNALVRQASVRYFSGQKDLDTLLKLLFDDNQFVAEAAFGALWAMKDESSIPHLISFLKKIPDNRLGKKVCEYFLNSGNPSLKDAAENWAALEGYGIKTRAVSYHYPKWQEK